jgi:hypothetical protein
MKHCPQCDFIYEDDQSVCDMDGKELVSDPAPLAAEQSFATPVSPINPISPMPSPVADAGAVAPVMQSANRRWRNFAVVTVVGFVLAALVIVLYVARTRQLRSRRAPETAAPSAGQSAARSSVQSTSGATNGQPSSPDLSSQSPSGSPLPEQLREPSAELSSSAQAEQAALSSASASREALAHPRLTPGPVSAGAPTGNSRGPVIVRLNNGAAIRADEVWEKREGIWYRQAGVVTFLKRSQVRKIEAAPAPAKSAPSNAQGRKTQNTAAPKPPRVAQLEPASPKKQSRLTSFLKKTGQVLKKPFKL